MLGEIIVLNEKWRPKTFSEVVGQDHIVPYLKEFVKNKNVPTMLFSGPAGTGKTTLAIVLARELYGNDWKNYFMEINASDDRGIDIVRYKIKDYARIKIIGKEFKIIFLDEVDAMTKEAQNALRRIIEMFSDKCRFILSCNFPNKLIDPIIDRCVVFRFKPLKSQEIKTMIDRVSKEENIDITPSAAMILAVLSDGSMRKALNTLEKLKLGNIAKIDDQIIYDTMAYVNDDHIRSLLASLSRNDFDTVDKYIENILYEKGYEPEEIIESLYRCIKESKILQKDKKLQALTKLGDIEFRIAGGSSSSIQLKTFMAYLLLLYQERVE